MISYSTLRGCADKLQDLLNSPLLVRIVYCRQLRDALRSSLALRERRRHDGGRTEPGARASLCPVVPFSRESNNNTASARNTPPMHAIARSSLTSLIFR